MPHTPRSRRRGIDNGNNSYVPIELFSSQSVCWIEKEKKGAVDSYHWSRNYRKDNKKGRGG